MDGAVYDITKLNWGNIANCPVGKRFCRQIIQDKLVFWGGYSYPSTFFNDGAVLDIKTNKWTKIPEGPFEKNVHYFSYFKENKLYCYGGLGKKECPPDGAIYELPIVID